MNIEQLERFNKLTSQFSEEDFLFIDDVFNHMSSELLLVEFSEHILDDDKTKRMFEFIKMGLMK